MSNEWAEKPLTTERTESTEFFKEVFLVICLGTARQGRCVVSVVKSFLCCAIFFSQLVDRIHTAQS
jgi:hypothetical protein